MSSLREKLEFAIARARELSPEDADPDPANDSIDQAWQAVRLGILLSDRTLQRQAEKNGGRVSNHDIWAAIVTVAHGCELAAEMMDRLDAKHAATEQKGD